MNNNPNGQGNANQSAQYSFIDPQMLSQYQQNGVPQYYNPYTYLALQYQQYLTTLQYQQMVRQAAAQMPSFKEMSEGRFSNELTTATGSKKRTYDQYFSQNTNGSENSLSLESAYIAAYGTPVAAKVNKIMTKMGFVEGKGLGTRLQGTTQAVDMKSQTTRAGLDFQPAPKIKQGLYRCTLCNKVFNDYTGTVTHLSSKGHGRVLERKVYVGNNANMLLDQHHISIECTDCNVKLRTLRELEAHSKTAIHKEVFPQVCELCNALLNSNQQKDAHIQSKKHTSAIKKLEQIVESTSQPTSNSQIDQTSTNSSFQSNSPQTPQSPDNQTLSTGSVNTQAQQLDFKSVNDQSDNQGQSLHQLVIRPMNQDSSVSSAQQALFVNWQCTICNLAFTSQVHMDSHMSGRKHRRNEEFFRFQQNQQSQPQQHQIQSTTPQIHLKSQPQPQPQTSNSTQPSVNNAGNFFVVDKTGSSLFCQICNIPFNSALQQAEHEGGNKHRKKLQSIVKIEPTNHT